mmetsp:Transcript_10863/g.26623  ORF Transcript_10863/g.26623 Transcript_10863/m.26623 type:complete len:332 (+) Transcript_10863:1694-2689(+)
MTDHHSLRTAGSATGVDESGTVSRFDLALPLFKGVLRGLFPHLHEFFPVENWDLSMLTLEGFGGTFAGSPGNDILEVWEFIHGINFLAVDFVRFQTRKLGFILENDYISLGMFQFEDHILHTIGGVDPGSLCPSADSTDLCKEPLGRIETVDSNSSKLFNPHGHKCPSSHIRLRLVLSVGPCLPLLVGHCRRSRYLAILLLERRGDHLASLLVLDAFNSHRDFVTMLRGSFVQEVNDSSRSNAPFLAIRRSWSFLCEDDLRLRVFRHDVEGSFRIIIVWEIISDHDRRVATVATGSASHVDKIRELVRWLGGWVVRPWVGRGRRTSRRKLA